MLVVSLPPPSRAVLDLKARLLPRYGHQTLQLLALQWVQATRLELASCWLEGGKWLYVRGKLVTTENFVLDMVRD